MIPTSRSIAGLAVLLLSLAAPAAAQSRQFADFRWSGAQVVIDARAESGVRVAIRRDSASDAAWFAPEIVTAWCDSITATLSKPQPQGGLNAWFRFTRPLPANNGHAPLSVLSSLLAGEDLYRIGFDDGKTLDRLSVDVPHVELEDFVSAMHEAADYASTVAGTGPSRIYLPYQVTKPVLVKPGNPVPKFPLELEGTSKGGTATVQFVVDSTGKAIMSTFLVIITSDMRFADAVKRVLPEYRFEPAEVDGRTVRQVVRMPFTFSVAH